MSDGQDEILTEATKQRIAFWQKMTTEIRATIRRRPVSNEEAVVLVDLADNDGWRIASAFVAGDAESMNAIAQCRKFAEECGEAIPSMAIVMTIDEAIEIVGVDSNVFAASMRIIRSQTTADAMVGIIAAVGGVTVVVVPEAHYASDEAGPFRIAPVVGSA